MLPGATASISTTRGRKRARSRPASTSASAPSTSILRKSIASIPASSISAESVRTGRRTVCEAGAEFACAGGVLAHGRGEAVQLVDDVELGLAVGAAGEAAHGVVARADVRVDAGQRLLRLDDQAAPALEVEPERDVVGDGVAAADVDVGAGLLVAEQQIEVVVLEVLCVGDLHRFAVGSGVRLQVQGFG